ncbi:MAG: epoxide hydrolase, partial [Acidimicrobiaceae bacterium]|nr:epoxide hydrolase [Acidimicrobiaceae bacterium]
STDLIAGNTPEAISSMQQALGDLRHCEIIEGAGHWLQQECSSEVSSAMVNFLEGLD